MHGRKATFGFVAGALTAGLALGAAGLATNDTPSRAKPAPGQVSLAHMPLTFEANRGQTDRRVDFLNRGSGYTLFLTNKGSVLSLDRSVNHAPAVLRTTLVGAAAARPRAEARLAGIVNILKGAKRNWHEGIPTYGRVRYASVYPGIDAVYHGRLGLLEYDFQVAAGADPARIQVAMGGARKLSLAPNGDLLIAMDGGTVREAKPIAYQTIRGARVPVDARFRLNGHRVGFALDAYDHSAPLVIDPVLSYSSYLGGSAEDQPEAIKVSPNDNTIFVVGYTKSNDFPGATPRTNTRTDYDAFITHLDSTGTSIEYTTYLGGSGTADDRAHDVTVDAFGDPIVVGETNATDFASASAPAIDNCTDGGKSAWQAQISTAAHTGVPYYKTCFGGNGDDIAYGVASHLTGSNLNHTRRVEVLVTGTATSATNFPQVGGYPNTNSGGDEVFLVQSRHVCSSGLPCDTIDYGTLLTETGADEARDVAVDGSGNAYITGWSTSDFLAGSAPKPGLQGHAFAGKINPNNTGSAAIVYFKWLTNPSPIDPNAADSAYAIAVSSAGVAYVAGQNSGGELLGSENLELFHALTQNAFVSVLASDGTPTKAIYVGSNGNASFKDISLTESGGVVSFYATGDFTGSVTANGAINRLSGQSCADGDKQVGLLKEANTPNAGTGSNTTVIYFSCLGGSNAHGDAGTGVSPGPNGTVWITGDTASFPTAGGPVQGAFAGGIDDGFIAQISPRSPVIDTATTVFGTHSPTFTYHSDDSGMTFSCSDESAGQLLGTRSGGACTGNGTTTYGNLDEGPHTFQVAGVDAGNTEGPAASRDFTVDTTPPGTFDLTSPDEGGSAGPQPTFSWTQPSDASDVSYELMIDGQKIQDVPSSACAGGTCSAEAASPIVGGTHKWKVVAHDAAVPTNTTTSASERSILIQDPPTARFVIAPNPLLTGRTATFNASTSTPASNPIVRYEWDLDGDGSFETDGGASPITAERFDKAGAVTIGLRVTDAVGQTGIATQVLKISDTASASSQLGVSINKGAQYTNKPDVTLTVVSPGGTSGLLIANDGGFAGALPMAVSKEVAWKLDSSGPERLPKTVYVRFLTGPFASPNYTDDIILDERPPVVDAASVVGPPAAAATAATLKAYKVKVKAHDTNSGVGFVQVTVNKRKPGKLLAYKKTVKTKLAARPKFLRARDRAGNYSPWKKLR